MTDLSAHPFTTAKKTAIRNLVRRAARAEILPRFRRLDSADIGAKTGPMDLVTDADIKAEEMITRGLQIAFPDAVVIGEEAVSENPALLDRVADAELSFLIDPVDGTWNFAKGLPLFGTMVAGCRFGQPVYGLIHDPLGDDAIEADLQSPASHHFAGRAARAVSSAAPQPRAELMGYTQLSLLAKSDAAEIARKMPEIRLLSTLRCSAHEYRMLAEGAVDFVLAARMTPWDHAAGVLICQKAGGHAAMLDGTDYSAALKDGWLLCASSKAVWDDIAELFGGLLAA